MSFLSEAVAYAATLRSNSSKKAILDYLIKFAKGYKNAKTWDDIHGYLRSINKSLTKTSFQQGLLKDSRAGNFFIASNDHSPARGYYIIITKQDAEMMRDWYKARIAKESHNLNRLRTLSTNYGMPCQGTPNLTHLWPRKLTHPDMALTCLVDGEGR